MRNARLETQGWLLSALVVLISFIASSGVALHAGPNDTSKVQGVQYTPVHRGFDIRANLSREKSTDSRTLLSLARIHIIRGFVACPLGRDCAPPRSPPPQLPVEIYEYSVQGRGARYTAVLFTRPVCSSSSDGGGCVVTQLVVLFKNVPVRKLKYIINKAHGPVR